MEEAAVEARLSVITDDRLPGQNARALSGQRSLTAKSIPECLLVNFLRTSQPAGGVKQQGGQASVVRAGEGEGCAHSSSPGPFLSSSGEPARSYSRQEPVALCRSGGRCCCSWLHQAAAQRAARQCCCWQCASAAAAADDARGAAGPVWRRCCRQSPHRHVLITPPLKHTHARAQTQVTMPSHKSLRIKKVLGKKAKQNRPIPYWIRFRTSEFPGCLEACARALRPRAHVQCSEWVGWRAAVLATWRAIHTPPRRRPACLPVLQTLCAVCPVQQLMKTPSCSSSSSTIHSYNRQQDPLQRQAPPLAPHQARHLERLAALGAGCRIVTMMMST